MSHVMIIASFVKFFFSLYCFFFRFLLDKRIFVQINTVLNTNINIYIIIIKIIKKKLSFIELFDQFNLLSVSSLFISNIN